ncbi:MAG: phosphate ABC transporter permease subunit PstC [Paracoccaceae bacterium]
MLAILVILGIALFAYALNARTARRLFIAGERLHSIGFFHAAHGFLLAALPAFVFLLAWLILSRPVIDALVLSGIPEVAPGAGARALILAEINGIAAGQTFGEPEAWKIEAAARMLRLRQTADGALIALVSLIAVAGLLFARSRVSAAFRARQRVERIIKGLLVLCSLIAIFTTVGIVASLLVESLRFFARVPVTEFLFGLNWEPQIPIREDQVAGLGAFGWLPVLLGTLVITVIAMLVALPVGLLSGIYLNEFAPRWLRSVSKPVLEILAGVPTVVYGFFAVLVVAPALRLAGRSLGLDVAPNTALAAGATMGVMLIPFISSFTDDALAAVPRTLRDGSLALGATRGETVAKVLFPAAIPGIVGGVLLAVSRAIGETMIVVMAAGLIARMTINPLDSVTTVTVQIVTLLVGDTAFDNPKTLAAFALGLMLFLVTLGVNVLALRVTRRYRELYD